MHIMNVFRLTVAASGLALLTFAGSALGQVENLRITELDSATGFVEITNFGPEFQLAVDATFCHRDNCLSFIPGGVTFDEGQIRTFFIDGLNASDSDVWMFKQGPFTSGSNLVHGLKYGPEVAVGATPLATSANLWPGNSLFAPAPPGEMTLAWDGFGFDPLDWYIDETPTIGSEDSTTPGYVPTGLQAPAGFQDFESILLGDEVIAMTGWQIVDTADPGLFTIRAVGDVNGVVAPRPGSTSTRWLRIRDQSFLTNILSSPAVTPASVTDYTWEMYINNERTPPSSAIAFPRLVIQHLNSGQFQDLWGIEFKDTGVSVVTAFLSGSTSSTPLFDLTGEFAAGQWVKITIEVSISGGFVRVTANDSAQATVSINPAGSVDLQEFRLTYRGDNAGNRHTLLLDDVIIATGDVTACAGDVDGVSPGTVDINDLLAVLGAWGTCELPCPPCPEDVAQDDCVVDINDLLFVLANWGPCD